MSNDSKLVDELENIMKQKLELEKKESETRTKIIEFAREKGTSVVFGNKKKCFIREYEKIIYPEDKTQLINIIKQKGLWDELSMINYSRFSSVASKAKIDKEVLDLVKKEKTIMVLIKDKEMF